MDVRNDDRFASDGGAFRRKIIVPVGLWISLSEELRHKMENKYLPSWKEKANVKNVRERVRKGRSAKRNELESMTAEINPKRVA